MKALPFLGPEDWIVDPKKKLDTLLAHVYASDASQTSFFTGDVSSIVKVIKDNQGKLENARNEIQNLLETYLIRYFEKVEVNVYIYENDDFHKGELVLAAEVTDTNGQKVQLHEVMTKKGSIVRTFLDYQA